MTTLIVELVPKSLEEILKLGYEIVNRETLKAEGTNVQSQYLSKPPRQSSPPWNKHTTSARKARTPSPTAKKAPVEVSRGDQQLSMTIILSL